MPKKLSAADPLLPTVNEPGTYAWAEEVVECINAAWRSRETGEQAFLAAVRAAVEHRIWETLSPPPPAEPYTSLANLVRRTAEAGQAENMQIVIKYSGLEEQAARGPRSGEVSAPWSADPAAAADPAEDPELALGRRLLDEYAAAAEPAAAAAPPYDPSRPVGIPAGVSLADVMAALVDAPSPAAPRVSPAQKKRERLEKTRPDLVDQVQAGELTLKQAYVEAGIDKQVSALDKLQKLWRVLSEEERDRFLGWLKQELEKERVASYHEEVYGED